MNGKILGRVASITAFDSEDESSAWPTMGGAKPHGGEVGIDEFLEAKYSAVAV